MKLNLPIMAGMIATILFATSTLPMVLKAYRTKDLQSYSLTYLLLGNGGNLFYSVYVFSMPLGPIWLLHSFYLITTGMMLAGYLRYEWWPGVQRRRTEQNTVKRVGPGRQGGSTPLRYPHAGYDDMATLG